VLRIYEIANPGWYAAVEPIFPVIRLTPDGIFRPKGNPIALVDTWLPDYNSSNLQQNSELLFNPVIIGLAQASSTAFSTAWHAINSTLVASTLLTGPVRQLDFGVKWIFEHRPGLMFTRDANYNMFPAQLSQDYYPLAPTSPKLGVTILCGVRSDFSWTLSAPYGAHTPNAVYVNFAWYTAAGAVAGWVLETDLKPINASATWAQPVFAHFGAAAQTVANNFYCITKAFACTPQVLAASPWGCSALQNQTIAEAAGILTITYRAYLNPNTKTGPSDFQLAKPMAAHVSLN